MQNLTIKQAAERLNCCCRTIYNLIQAKKIDAFKVGNRWRINEKTIESYIKIQSMINE